jgi:arylsulfatase A-like enzyme
MGGVLASAIAAGASETFADGLRRKPSGRLLETAAATVTDVDGDGFGLAGGMRDPALFDGSIFPWAVDLPGNGIDEDGIGGDLPADALPYVEGDHARAPWTSHPDVVLFVLESFRADAVGRRVNGRPVTPILDGLANEGISVSAAYSHNGYTAQSRFHLMTGSLAGLRGGTSLIDDFAANGYETAYFSAQDESFGGEALGVGFERATASYDARRDRGQRYSTFSTPGSLAVSYKTLEARVAAFLEQRDRGRPLFLYVNFHDTHYPYHHDQILPLVSSTFLPASQIAPASAGALQEMYFNTAANVDSAVGRVVEKTAVWLGRSPAVIVTADHGESLFDEGFVGHGYKLNDVQTRVPLIVRGLPLHIEEPFGQIDLRDALNTALTHDPSDLKPRLDRRQDKAVFQYLGNIDRPRQIGLVTGSGQLVYDFRQQRVRTTRTEAWRRIEDLTSDEHARFQQLLWSWERMMLARKRR